MKKKTCSLQISDFNYFGGIKNMHILNSIGPWKYICREISQIVNI